MDSVFCFLASSFILIIISRICDSLSGFITMWLAIKSLSSGFFVFDDVVIPSASHMFLKWTIRSTGPLSSNLSTGVGVDMTFDVKYTNSDSIDAVIIFQVAIFQ